MLALSLDVSETSSFLRSRRNVKILAELKGEDIPVSLLLEQLFTIAPSFIPDECFHATPSSEVRIENLRGRPLHAFPQDEQPRLSDLKHTQQEELFYTSGVVLEPEEESLEIEEPGEEYAEAPFTFRITTRFETFRKTNNIVYRVYHSPSPVLDEVRPHLTGRLLARLLPFRLDTIRLGLESYHSRSYGSLFGSVPSVRDKLYLEISRNSIRLDASGDYPRKDRSLPFAKDNLLTHLDTALRDTGLFPNLFQEISGRLGARQ